MPIQLEINNATLSPVPDGFFVSVAEKTLQELKYEFLKDKNISVSLALVSPEEIKKLNKEYRRQDEATDVLSFPEFKDMAEIKAIVDNEVFLGELVLCYDDIKQYSENENIKLEGELAKVVSHGILHLLGFAHGEEMFAVQERLSKMF